jgi:hypothetical protein
MDSEPDNELEQLERDELWGSLETEISQEAEVLQNSDTALYQRLMRSISSNKLEQAEKN